MPIVGVTDSPSWNRVGKVRLGVKKQSQKGTSYPVATDYFVVRDDDGVTLPEAAKNFHRVYGDQPRELQILLPGDDVRVLFPHDMVYYTKAGVQCKGDGVHGITAQGEVIQCQQCAYRDKDCAPLGRFFFMLPNVQPLGVWQLDTRSIISIRNIWSALTTLARLRVGMVHCRMILVPLLVNVPGFGPKKVHVIRLVLPEWDILKEVKDESDADDGLPMASEVLPQDVDLVDVEEQEDGQLVGGQASLF